MEANVLEQAVLLFAPAALVTVAQLAALVLVVMCQLVALVLWILAAPVLA